MKHLHVLPGLFLALLIASPVFAHPDHVSIAEANFNHQSRRFEISMRCDSMHFEDALGAWHGRRVSLERTPGLNTLLSQYVLERFQLRTARGDLWTLTWIGHEIVDLDIWMYFEMEAPDNHAGQRSIEVRHDVMLGWMPRQINTITFRCDEERASVRTTSETPRWQSVTLPIARPATEQRSWARSSTVDVSEATGHAGLARVAAAIGQSRIVLLGTPGQPAALAHRQRLVDFLCARAGFSVLALETDPLTAALANPPGIERMPNAVQVVGYDAPRPGNGLGERLAAFLRPALPDAANGLEFSLLDSSDKPDPATVDRLLVLLLELVELDRLHHATIVGIHGTTLADAFTRTVNGLAIAVGQAALGTPGDLINRSTANQRAFAQAANLAWIAKTFGSSNILVIATRARVDRSISEDGGVRTPMGNWLQQHLGPAAEDAVYSIIYTNNTREGQLERTLSTVGFDAVFLDLTRVPEDHPVHTPMTGSPPLMPSGRARSWPAIVDGIILTSDLSSLPVTVDGEP